jgi:putative selenate reductase molybdopterin-binding subunit
MNITLTINGTAHETTISPNETLLATLRGLGFHGVKFGDEQGLSGADTVLLDGKPVNAGSMLAAQAEGHKVVTIEGLGEHPDQGWKKTGGLHPLQQAFIETGAIQCGYCTPGQILAAKALLEENPNPSEAEVREAIAGVLCRCTGYAKPVQAVLRAAAVMRGEASEPIEIGGVLDLGGTEPISDDLSGMPAGSGTQTRVAPKIILTPQVKEWQTVGKPEKKVDAVKLAQGKPAFAADIEKRGMLVAKVLHSPMPAHQKHRHQRSQGHTGCGCRAHLAGYPARGLLHRRAVRPDPRAAGLLLS